MAAMKTPVCVSPAPVESIIRTDGAPRWIGAWGRPPPRRGTARGSVPHDEERLGRESWQDGVTHALEIMGFREQARLAPVQGENAGARQRSVEDVGGDLDDRAAPDRR